MFGSDSNINAHTPDLSFRYMGNEWIEALHENLGLPGEFHDLIINDVATNPNTNIRLDIHEIANVEDSFKNKINIDIEHQSTKLSEDEMKRFWNYKDYSQCNNHYPVLSVVVTPFSEEVQETVFKPTESDILKPLMICIDDESIKKRLNTLRKKVNNKEIIEDSIVLDFSLIAIFVRNNKYEILKELCDLFKRAE